MASDRLGLGTILIGVGLVTALMLLHTAGRNERKMEKLRKDLVTAARMVTDPKQAQVHACALLGCISDQLEALTAATIQQRHEMEAIARKIGTLPPEQVDLIRQAVGAIHADIAAREAETARRGVAPQPKRKRGRRS